MNIKDYIDKVESIELEEIKDKKISDLIAKFHAKNLIRLYILKDKKPIYVFSPKEIVDIFINNQQNINAYEFLKDKKYIDCFDADIHIIDAYYKMRKDNRQFMPVCEDNQLIGELDFNTFSLKITYFVIKDELSGVYNKKYFDVIIEEYSNFDNPMGIIFVEIKDLPIFEGLYGIDMIQKIIKTFAKTLTKSVRSIDFIFRWDNQFRIIIFNNLEVTAKVFDRIQNRLNQIEIDGITIPFKMCFTHIPQLNSDILIALEECEEKLIKRD